MEKGSKKKPHNFGCLVYDRKVRGHLDMNPGAVNFVPAVNEVVINANANAVANWELDAFAGNIVRIGGNIARVEINERR